MPVDSMQATKVSRGAILSFPAMSPGMTSPARCACIYRGMSVRLITAFGLDLRPGCTIFGIFLLLVQFGK